MIGVIGACVCDRLEHVCDSTKSLEHRLPHVCDRLFGACVCDRLEHVCVIVCSERVFDRCDWSICV